MSWPSLGSGLMALSQLPLALWLHRRFDSLSMWPIWPSSWGGGVPGSLQCSLQCPSCPTKVTHPASSSARHSVAVALTSGNLDLRASCLNILSPDVLCQRRALPAHRGPTGSRFLYSLELHDEPCHL